MFSGRMDDEHAEAEGPVWVGRPSHWHFFWTYFLGLVIAPGLIVLLYFLGVRGAVLASPLAVTLFVLLVVAINRQRVRYTVTPTKVIIEFGFVARSSDELRIKDIRSIAVRKHGLSGLFGIGTIEFSSAAADDADVTFRAVPRVTAVRDLVRRYQESV